MAWSAERFMTWLNCRRQWDVIIFLRFLLRFGPFRIFMNEITLNSEPQFVSICCASFLIECFFSPHACLEMRVGVRHLQYIAFRTFCVCFHRTWFQLILFLLVWFWNTYHLAGHKAVYSHWSNCKDCSDGHSARSGKKYIWETKETKDTGFDNFNSSHYSIFYCWPHLERLR